MLKNVKVMFSATDDIGFAYFLRVFRALGPLNSTRFDVHNNQLSCARLFFSRHDLAIELLTCRVTFEHIFTMYYGGFRFFDVETR